MALRELTLEDVAELLRKAGQSGFSVSILSRVLNGRPDFTTTEKLRIIAEAVKAATMPKASKEEVAA
jgi:hypothetical protein